MTFSVQDSGHASDDLDHSGPEMGANPVQNDALIAAAKRRRLTKAAEAKLKAKEKKRRGIKDSDDDDDIDEDDERYNAPSSRPAPGSFAHCALCEKRFTVVCRAISILSYRRSCLPDDIHRRCYPRAWLVVSSMCESIRD